MTSRGPGIRPRRQAAALLAASLLLTGCGAGAETVDGSAHPPPEPSGTPTDQVDERSPSPRGDACPPAYAEPNEDRPRIDLQFTIGEDMSTVQGVEEVSFVPDREIDQVVFRLTPNGPSESARPTELRITEAGVVGGSSDHGFEEAGAREGTQGGLLVIPLDSTADAGDRVEVRVEFTLTLGTAAFERYGHDDGYAWWGTGQPLFAWERGVGWHREPLLSFIGESATSEAAEVELTVTAPADLTVVSSGVPAEPTAGDGATREWRSSADSARDVSVAVGPFQTESRTVGETEVTVGGPDASELANLLDHVEFAITELAERYGPFPYEALNLARLPLNGGGIEYPGSILLMGSGRSLVVHEVAHEWFYGMVGNSQALDPWMDEAFATFSEYLVDDTAPDENYASMPGDVGASMADFEKAFGEGGYFQVVYQKGALALLAAREAAGAARFDDAMRCYVNANAWEVAQPDDVAHALRDLPKALDVLRTAGAID